jgi:hypothetical protein
MTKTDRPPIEYSSADASTVIKLVSNALVSQTRKPGSKTLILERTTENKLIYFARSSIIEALERIAKSGHDLFGILRLNYTRKIIAREPVDFFDEGKSRLRIVKENTPIILLPLGKFDNWCEAQLRNKNISVKDLAQQTREMLYRTVLAINNEFELSSNPTVRISSLPESDTEDFVSRRKAVEFLFNRDIVHRYDPSEETGVIDLQINVREFLEFRNDLFGSYQDGSKQVHGTGIKSAKSLMTTKFRSMEGLKWAEITIKFVDGHTVRISARQTKESFSYKEMGLDDARTGNPNEQWKLLKTLADNHGTLDWEDSEATDLNKKRKQNLSKALKIFFGIDDDPFYPYREHNGYRTKIKLLPEIGPVKYLVMG